MFPYNQMDREQQVQLDAQTKNIKANTVSHYGRFFMYVCIGFSSVLIAAAIYISLQ